MNNERPAIQYISDKYGDKTALVILFFFAIGVVHSMAMVIRCLAWLFCYIMGWT